MTKVAIIGTGPCGLSMLRAFEQAETFANISSEFIFSLIRFLNFSFSDFKKLLIIFSCFRFYNSDFISL